MLFENINQYNKAKNVLIESEGDIELALESLKKDNSFSDMSENELYDSLKGLKEGLGDKLLNFFSGALGGDISKIKTVLSQMKDQELKFNREELEINKEFLSSLQDEEALQKDKSNPDYQNLMNSIKTNRNSLNNRYKDLQKMYDDIFNALEQKVKDLTENSTRKKKFFNAQRAIDVIETAQDRYEKRKSVNPGKKSKDLEDFFGLSSDKLKKDVEKAKDKAKKSEETLTAVPPSKKGRSVYDEDPEKGFYFDFLQTQNSPGGFTSKRKYLKKILKDIEDEVNSSGFKSYSGEKQNDILNIRSMVQDYYNRKEKEDRG